MKSLAEKTGTSVRRRNCLFLAGLVGVALAASIALELTAASVSAIGGFAVVWTIFSAFLFNLIFLLARWLFAKSRRRMFLLGRFPYAIGLVKVGTLTVFVMLVLLLVAGLAAGKPYSEVAVRALILGLVAWGVVTLVANGLLNAIIVVRHFRGTLVETSRVR